MLTDKDLINPVDGTKLAAFVDPDDDTECFENFKQKDSPPKIVSISWSWPPPSKKEPESDRELLSSYEMV